MESIEIDSVDSESANEKNCLEENIGQESAEDRRPIFSYVFNIVKSPFIRCSFTGYFHDWIIGVSARYLSYDFLQILRETLKIPVQ